MGVSACTGKNIKSTKNYAMHDHMLVCNNVVSFEDFYVLANGTNDFRIILQESPLIHPDGSHLKKHLSQPLLCYSLKTYHMCSFTSLYCSSKSFDK